MASDVQHPPASATDESRERTDFSFSVDAVRNLRRLKRALARARAAIRDAREHGDAPHPALLARVTAIQREIAALNHDLAVYRRRDGNAPTSSEWEVLAERSTRAPAPVAGEPR